MHELTIIKQDGCAYIDSREVAEAIGKRHDNLLRDIDGYVQILSKRGALKIEDTSFFVKSTYVDAWNRAKPCYLISRLGADIVAHKLTGEKGVLFTAMYVTRFHELETAEREAELKANAKPRLGEFNTAVRNVLNGMSYCFSSPKRVMNFLRGAYKPFGIEVLDNVNEDYNYFSATEIAEHIGIYSDTNRPHGHAVSAIISKFGDVSKHAVAVPYGLVGVMMKYDRYIVNKVRNWIEEHNYPYHVPHLDFEYHIRYEKQLSLCDYCAGDF